jgi:hypothetical protein
MQAIVTAIGFLLGKIVAAVRWIGELFVAVFVALWELITDGFCWVFEQILDIAIVAMNAFDFSGLSSYVGAWAGLPGGVIEVLAALGVSTAIGLIITAIGIRLLLQLIPFTRLGS